MVTPQNSYADGAAAYFSVRQNSEAPTYVSVIDCVAFEADPLFPKLQVAATAHPHHFSVCGLLQRSRPSRSSRAARWRRSRWRASRKRKAWRLSWNKPLTLSTLKFESAFSANSNTGIARVYEEFFSALHFFFFCCHGSWCLLQVNQFCGPAQLWPSLFIGQLARAHSNRGFMRCKASPFSSSWVSFIFGSKP